jgi:hypothetical protein
MKSSERRSGFEAPRPLMLTLPQKWVAYAQVGQSDFYYQFEQFVVQ